MGREVHFYTLEEAIEEGVPYREQGELTCEYCGKSLEQLGIVGYDGVIRWVIRKECDCEEARASRENQERQQENIKRKEQESKLLRAGIGHQRRIHPLHRVISARHRDGALLSRGRRRRQDLRGKRAREVLRVGRLLGRLHDDPLDARFHQEKLRRQVGSGHSEILQGRPARPRRPRQGKREQLGSHDALPDPERALREAAADGFHLPVRDLRPGAKDVAQRRARKRTGDSVADRPGEHGRRPRKGGPSAPRVTESSPARA